MLKPTERDSFADLKSFKDLSKIEKEAGLFAEEGYGVVCLTTPWQLYNSD